MNTAVITAMAEYVARLVPDGATLHTGPGQLVGEVLARLGERERGKRYRDAGAAAVYIHGGVGDRFVEENKVDQITKAVEYIKQQGVVSGVAGHLLQTIKAYEAAQVDPDFYMKTINSKSYWSAGIQPRHDSVWAETPEETAAFMREVDKPWIAYKILGAGAIHPGRGALPGPRAAEPQEARGLRAHGRHGDDRQGVGPGARHLRQHRAHDAASGGTRRAIHPAVQRWCPQR